MLHGRYRLSEREIPALLSDLFALPISLGSVVDLRRALTTKAKSVFFSEENDDQA